MGIKPSARSAVEGKQPSGEKKIGSVPRPHKHDGENRILLTTKTIIGTIKKRLRRPPVVIRHLISNSTQMFKGSLHLKNGTVS